MYSVKYIEYSSVSQPVFRGTLECREVFIDVPRNVKIINKHVNFTSIIKFNNNRDKNQLSIIINCHVVMYYDDIDYYYQMCFEEKFKIAFAAFACMNKIATETFFRLFLPQNGTDDWLLCLQINIGKRIQKLILKS